MTLATLFFHLSHSVAEAGCGGVISRPVRHSLIFPLVNDRTKERDRVTVSVCESDSDIVHDVTSCPPMGRPKSSTYVVHFAWVAVLSQV
jgi:hypothetical protein